MRGELSGEVALGAPWSARSALAVRPRQPLVVLRAAPLRGKLSGGVALGAPRSGQCVEVRNGSRPATSLEASARRPAFGGTSVLSRACHIGWSHLRVKPMMAMPIPRATPAFGPDSDQ